MGAYIFLGASFLAIACLLSSSPVLAQQPAPTKNLVTIETGNKFQQILPEGNTGEDRRALTITNNNTNGDTCWVFVGTGRASKEESDQVSRSQRGLCPVLAICSVG